MNESEKNTQASAKPVTAKTERTPFPVTANGFTREVLVMKDGHGDTIYYFRHPTEWEPVRDQEGNEVGRRRKRIKDPDKDTIKVLLEAALNAMVKNEVVLPREEYTKLQDASKRLERLLEDLKGTDLSPEMLVGLVPTYKELQPEGVTLAQALEDGRACHLPRFPKTVNAVIDELIQLIRKDSTQGYCDELLFQWEPLRRTFGDQGIHRVWPPTRLEQLLREVDEGKFLSDRLKKKILTVNKWSTPPVVDGRESWYSDKSLVHFYNSWRRVFIRADAIDAWPTLRRLPTEVMEKPKADQPDLEALPANDWRILLPNLEGEELLYVALLLADIRKAEIGRLEPSNIKSANGLASLVIVPKTKVKGKKGKKIDRKPTLDVYVSLLIYMSGCRLDGEQLFSRELDSIHDSIKRKAKALGIELTQNCLRHMRDTYWYALNNEFNAVDRESSHSKKYSDVFYRTPASLEEALSVYTTFPKGTPENFKLWVLDWLEPLRRKFRGGPIPAPEGAEAPDEVLSEGSVKAGQDEDTLARRPTEQRPEPIEAAARVSEEDPRPAVPDETKGDGAAKARVDAKSESHSAKGTQTDRSNEHGSIPEPPRRPGGRIDWTNITLAFMAPIVKDFTHAEIAKAWDVSTKSIDVGIYKMRKAEQAAQTSEQGQNNSSERSSGPPSEPEKLNKSEDPEGEPDGGEDDGKLAVHML